MKAIVLVTAIGLIACGAEKKDEDSEALKKSIENGEDIEFSGYVQKAFTITVNGEQFSDSEGFYTNFIETLVKPKYETLKDADVQLEGEYGVGEFGRNSKIFMSAEGGDGHLFESRTDGTSKFTLNVKAKALDEIFKARIIIRIGLKIKQAGSDDINACYILHGNREGIVVSENSKPIIFDSFSTQLNTYKCEDVKENELVIPGLGGGVPADDGGVVTNPDGNAALSSFLKITDTVKISYPLAGNEEGKNLLGSAYMSPTGELWISKARVKNKDNGKFHIPIAKLSTLSSPTLTRMTADEATDNRNTGLHSLVTFEGNIIGVLASAESSGADTVPKVVQLKEGGSIEQNLAELPTTISYIARNARHTLLPMPDGSLSLASRKICKVDFDGDPNFTCIDEPQSNKCTLTGNSSAVYFNGSYLALMANDGVRQGCQHSIQVFNGNSVNTSFVAVSKLTVSQVDIAEGKLVTNGTDIYLVNIAGNDLVVRTIAIEQK